MTSPTLARWRRNARGSRKLTAPLRAFTLVEMLVVIGILGLLIALLLPMITRSLRAARRTRTAADLQSIANALDQFRQDTGDYPRVSERGTGFAVLTRALIGPGDD